MTFFANEDLQFQLFDSTGGFISEAIPLPNQPPLEQALSLAKESTVAVSSAEGVYEQVMAKQLYIRDLPAGHYVLVVSGLESEYFVDFAAPPPAPDTDADGIIDPFDLCPDDPEDVDGFFDTDGCPDPSVAIDIKAGSCPNSWNRESNGVLPVAILGTEDFDVTEIDVSSVTISRADGTGDSVAPNEGPPGPHSVFEDVGTPFEGEECDCHEAEGDGILDLSMKFKTQDVADLLLVDDPNGALVPLVVSGTLLDGTEFTTRSDCVRLVPPGSPPNQVTVKSIPGSWIDATPLDNQLDGGGFGSFRRTYPHTTVLTLTAPPGHNGIAFVGWKVDGGELVEERAITLVVNNAEHVAKAVFKLVISCGLGFELALLVPPLMWLHGRRRRTAA
jgi:hypothetical protein